MARDSVGRTFAVATILCLVCSVLVSSAAIGLRKKQEANRVLERNKNVLLAAGLIDEAAPRDEILALFDSVERHLIDLETGKLVQPNDVPFKLSDYDPRAAAGDPHLSANVEPPNSLPGIPRRERFAFIYLIKKDGELATVVLPVYGKGLWSTLYGFLALDADMQTIRGITFYQHAETPGLGGEVDNPRWKAQWNGKLAFAEKGDVVIEVLKGGQYDPSGPGKNHQVDGLSGATITTRGVSNLVRYWLGPDGFGAFLGELRKGA